MENFDVLVIGAGAAGMMCAIEAGKRGRSVLAIDHAKAPGEKIRISGGGRCNFTNTGASIHNFLSANPKFALSALRRYRPKDFIALVERYGVAYHEKTLGQLFCDGSAKQIIDMLLTEMRAAGVTLRLETAVQGVTKADDGFKVTLSSGEVRCASLVVASGGKSIPKMGATGLGYDIAKQFGLGIVETRPALVPLTFEPGMLARLTPLSGVALDAVVAHGKTKFREGMLFTHRGLSGPSILQISSYWREGDEIRVDMAPGVDALAALKAARTATPRQAVATVLSTLLPKRVAQVIAEEEAAGKGNIADCSDKVLGRLAAAVNAWTFKPVGSEGYRTAEVTLGGVDTDDLDSRTLEAKAVRGLYFIGEVVDVTGWLGGYNFQWAWASGWSAGQVA
ncbi:NAD(P)/FAD-dependent oxidoreductase [Caulobacter segnis]|uniref:HI0933 family protein n=2 Tax=Caulobacter segnis TaxID=88688 RepID=D5VJM0_CAUST|nr:NAD(P)/FAD-dependent oxidoreductase [Caulobacter segnis]ADG10429.1 HI0933 family protein [Caulobacter segnis ATCC 21756]AVQ02158.1 NAD(P)/FAD-dependent oxidoreductase [Caulobacter segnis]